MRRQIVRLALLCLCAGQPAVHAQEFKFFDRTVQVHGWLSQGLAYSDENNYLTMNTSSGSGAFTDAGLSMSSPITVNGLTDGAHLQLEIGSYAAGLRQIVAHGPSLAEALGIDFHVVGPDWQTRDHVEPAGLGGGLPGHLRGLMGDGNDGAGDYRAGRIRDRA